MRASWVNSDISAASATFFFPFLIHSDVYYRKTLLFCEEEADILGCLEQNHWIACYQVPGNLPLCIDLELYRLMLC